MIEIIDNSIQFTATLICCAVSGVLYLRRRSTERFLLACFYGCFALGLLYWTLYLVFFESTPDAFYVSEIIWISSCIFLYLLQYNVAGKEGQRRSCRAAWLAPALGAVMLAFYCIFGSDIPAAILRCSLMTALAWKAICGLCSGGRRPFHTAALCFVGAEYALWASSVHWLGDTLANPYFWIDFLLTGILVSLLPASGEAVKP